jgi:hypothetical protein
MRMLAVKSGGRLTEKKAEVEAEPGQGSQKWARWRRLVARDGLGRWVDPRSMGHLTSCSCGAAVSVDNTATPHTGAGPSISASRNRRGLRGAASRPLPGRCGATATVPVPACVPGNRFQLRRRVAIRIRGGGARYIGTASCSGRRPQGCGRAVSHSKRTLSRSTSAAVSLLTNGARWVNGRPAKESPNSSPRTSIGHSGGL